MTAGGLPRLRSADRAARELRRIRPQDAVGIARRQAAVELLGEVRDSDRQLAELRMRIVAGVRAADTTVTNLYGVDGLSSARTPSRSENVRSALAGTSADCRRTGKRSLASRRQRWGSEVVAVVALVEGTTTTADELIQHAGKTLARYRLPKAVVFRSEIARSPSGKADYRWAREQANDANAAAS